MGEPWLMGFDSSFVSWKVALMVSWSRGTVASAGVPARRSCKVSTTQPSFMVGHVP